MTPVGLTISGGATPSSLTWSGGPTHPAGENWCQPISASPATGTRTGSTVSVCRPCWPMSDRLIPYSRQQVTPADVEAVVAAMGSDYLTTGPTVRRFEEALARAGGVRRAVAVSSGTAA